MMPLAQMPIPWAWWRTIAIWHSPGRDMAGVCSLRELLDSNHANVRERHCVIASVRPKGAAA
jgi:hypothetical protein